MVSNTIPEHTYFRWGMIKRLCVQFIFPWPCVEYVILIPQLQSSGVKYVPYFLSDLLMIFMFYRMYQVLRHYERYHEYTDLDSKAVCRRFNTPGGIMFAIKCELKFNQYKVITFLFVFSVSVLAYILRLWELPYDQNLLNNATSGSRNNLQDYGSAIWLTVITMTTVGYGDIYPHTVGGQLTAIFIAIWGTFVISLLIMITSQVFDFTDAEQGAVLTIIKQRAAGKSILNALKFYQKKKAFY